MPPNSKPLTDDWIQGLPTVEAVREHEERGGWWIAQYEGVPVLTQLYVFTCGGEDHVMSRDRDSRDCEWFPEARWRAVTEDGTPLALADSIEKLTAQRDTLQGEVANLRQRVECWQADHDTVVQQRDDARERIDALTDEKARLAGEVERLRGIVRGIVDCRPWQIQHRGPLRCMYCDASKRMPMRDEKAESDDQGHGSRCLWMRARTLLTVSGTPTGSGGGTDGA